MVTAARLTDRPWSKARWLVLAPHPDDETLGAGALINHAAKNGRLGGIVFLTDGTGSHPAGTPRLAGIRRSEARRAIRRLGAGATRIDWIDWNDGHPHEPGSQVFLLTARWLSSILEDRRIDAVAVSDRTDAHCDHVAAFDLARTALGFAHRPLALFAYHVWSAPPPGGRKVVTPTMPPGLRRHALRAHRSQTSPSLGHGFQLSRAKQRMASRDILSLRSGR